VAAAEETLEPVDLLQVEAKKVDYIVTAPGTIEAFEDLLPDKKFSKQQASLKYLRKAQKSLGQLNDDANGHSLATALQENGVQAHLEFLSAKREKRLIRSAAAAYRKLAALKPVFDPEGTTTAGNAPGVNDGAGALVVTSEEFARKRGLEVLATIVSQAYVADEFAYLARTPAKAGAAALAKAGKKIGDVERVELNEAFASVALNSAKLLDVDPDKVNVNGGAVALGHPIGASGARILGTMIYELRRNGGGLGLAAICSGGGQGDALLIEV
jgi:acetyl-CoA acetyltransferase family protein